MVEAGQRLRRARERLNLKYRDVEQASQLIAERRGNTEFVIRISRLSDIENQGTVPSIYRLYSLCCIYRLDITEVLGWYNVPLESMAADASLIQIEKTHGISFNPDAGAEAMLPISLDPGIDLRRTFFCQRGGAALGKAAAGAAGRGRCAALSIRLCGHGGLVHVSDGAARFVAGGGRRQAQNTGRRMAQSERKTDLFSGTSGWILLPLVQREGRGDQPDRRS